LTKEEQVTNATKAGIITLANTLLALLVAFGVSLSDAQTAAIVAALNAALALWVGLTFQNSAKRVPDA
jgi:hypothetical protein